MGTYILRRLILMIPTLIGITLLVFLLIALSPGGIGAALSAAGGQMDTSSRAQQQAYLEDRYGLDSPVLVQYARWLGRVSPVKFGQRDQVTPQGEIERPPKPLQPPVNWHWVADELPTADPVPPVVWPAASELSIDPSLTPAEALAQHKNRAYRLANSEYIRERGRYVARRMEYEDALRDYAREMEIPGAVTRDRKLNKRAIKGLEPNRDAASWPRVVETGRAALAAYDAAIDARERLRAVFDAKPYREAGVAIIPGYLSVAAPDLGRSFSKSQPVSRLIAERLPVTLLLNVFSIPIIYLIAIPGGMLAAVHRGRAFDVISGMIFVALWSIPVVWAGVLLIGFVANRQYLGWFPVNGLHDANADGFLFLPSWDEAGNFHRGYLLDTLWHMCLPVVCLVYTGLAVLGKQTRAAMLDNLNADYVRTAKAKGVASRDIILHHVFRNSLLPLITIFATIFPAMLAGSVVIEKIFSIPGMGSLIIESIYLRDREVILANVLMVGAVNILALLLADILYAAADPRITYD